jgi:hypothetical protein
MEIDGWDVWQPARKMSAPGTISRRENARNEAEIVMVLLAG